MPGGRHSPALFELLRGNTGTREASSSQAARIPSTPAARPALAPMPAPVPRAAPTHDIPPAPRPLAGTVAPGFELHRRVTVSMFWAWLAVALAILGGIGLWSVAYNVGWNTRDRSAMKEAYKPESSGAISEPLRGSDQIPVNPGLVITPQPGPKPSGGGAAAQPGPTAVKPGTDPRVAGFNYLVVAYKMDRETADRAVNFLNQNSVPAFAIAVARTGSGANNEPTYTVYAQRGITRDEYRSKTPSRTDLEDRVARLGKIWQKEHKGQTDFSRTTWEKFGS